MAEDEHQDEEKSRVLQSSEPEPGQGGEGRPSGPRQEEEEGPRPEEDRDATGPGGGPEQPPPPGTEPQAPGHETALADVVPEAAAAASAGSEAGGAPGGTGGRLEELMAKRRTTGLSDAEAEELGTMLAEQEGKPHSSAQSLKRGPAAQE